MTNVIFMLNVDLKGEGRYSSDRIEPYTFSIQSWKNWSKLNNCEMFILEDTVQDNNDMAICWQRYYVHDILESNGIDYDQILMVDADTIVHPDCPNFFEMTDGKYCGVFNNGSYDWLLRSIENYSKYAFSNQMIDWTRYINGGFQIFNKNHKDFHNEILNIYSNNSDIFKQLQNTFHTGTDQTPLNFFLQTMDVDVKVLPYEFNMQDMFRKEILLDYVFTNVGWVYHFNAIPQQVKDHLGGLTNIMKGTFEKLWK